MIKILIRDFRLQLLNLKKHLLYWLCVFRMNSCMYYVVVMIEVDKIDIE